MNFSNIQHFWRLATMLTAMLLSTTIGYSQDKNRLYPYSAVVGLMGDQPDMKGTLYQVYDSSIVLFKGNYIDMPNNMDFQTVAVKNISKIKLRPNSTGNHGLKRGLWIGVISGLAVGGVGFLVWASNEESGLVSLAIPYFLIYGAVGGAILGSTVGIIANSINLNIHINGETQRYNRKRSRLKRYAYQP